MSVSHNRKHLKDLGKRLMRGESLSHEERSYLGIVLARIGDGDSADEVLGLKYAQGRRKTSDDARANLGMIFMWISNAIDPDMSVHQTQPYGVDDAIRKAAQLSADPGYPLFKPISYSSLRKAWYNPGYAILKRTQVSSLSPDFPEI